MPTNAPAIVGSIDSASSQYVLRRTLFGATAGTATCSGIDHRVFDSPVGTGLSCGSMESLTRKRSHVTIRAYPSRRIRLAETPEVSMVAAAPRKARRATG